MTQHWPLLNLVAREESGGTVGCAKANDRWKQVHDILNVMKNWPWLEDMRRVMGNSLKLTWWNYIKTMIHLTLNLCLLFLSVSPISLCLSLVHKLLLSPCLSSSLLSFLSLSQSIASCLFSSLRYTLHFSGRSGSWLRQGEAIKTTADWNRLREQQCKLKGAHVVEQGVNSNRLAPWNKEAHTSHPHGEQEPYASAADWVFIRGSFYWICQLGWL